MLQAGVKEKFQMKRKRGKLLAPMAPPSAEPSSDQPSNSEQATDPPSPLEQPEVDVRSESTAAEIADVSLRHCKGKTAHTINVDLAEEKTSPLDARPYPDSYSFVNAEVGSAAFEVLRRFIPSADRQVLQEISLRHSSRRQQPETYRCFCLLRRWERIETISYCEDKELRLNDELETSQAQVVELEVKVVEREASIVRLQEKVAAAETAYLQADKEVQAAKAEVERVKAILEQEKKKFSDYMGQEAERFRQFGEAHWEERKAAFLNSEEFARLVVDLAYVCFENGFECAVAQFKAQLYPPEGADTDFLDLYEALDRLPPETFDPKP